MGEHGPKGGDWWVSWSDGEKHYAKNLLGNGKVRQAIHMSSML
jgi:hypothetical protein